MSGEISGIQFFKVTFFSAKNAFPAAIISQLFSLCGADAESRPTKNVRETPFHSPRLMSRLSPQTLPLAIHSRKKQPAGSAVRTPPQQNAAGACF